MRPTTTRQPFWEAHGLPAPNSALRWEDYLALPAVNIHIEWHNGIVIYPNWDEVSMSPSPTTDHQRLVVRLIQRLSEWVPNGEILTAPMDVRLGTQTVQPDVFWVAADGACSEQGTHFEGAPDLIVEVLSPNNTAHDRITKFELYQASGVREYWIANATELYIEVYTLQSGGYHRLGAFRSGQSFVSPVMARQIDLNLLWGV